MSESTSTTRRNPSWAWTLLFRTGDGVGHVPHRKPSAPVPDTRPAGWAGTDGPAIEWRHWPRSATTGLPMLHVLSFWLPTDYRRRGEEFPAIAFFAGEGEAGSSLPIRTGDATSDDPFLRDLAAAEAHPGLVRFRDIIDGEFALMWLREHEIAGGPRPAVADLRLPGTYPDDSEGHGAWDADPDRDTACGRETPLWLVPRPDPNTGIAPRELHRGEVADNGYVSVWDETGTRHAWADTLNIQCHLGGTVFPSQALPEGLTPWYFELEEIAGVNFGGGNAQIDLESGVFDWACG